MVLIQTGCSAIQCTHPCNSEPFYSLLNAYPKSHTGIESKQNLNTVGRDIFTAAYFRDFFPLLANTMDTEVQFNGKRRRIEAKHPAAVFLSCCSCY